MTEVRLKGENWIINSSIFVPYEINHDFFLEIELKIAKGKIPLNKINIAGPDFGKGGSIEGEKIDKFIEDCEYIKVNLDTIIKIVPIPEKIGAFDDRYTEGFKGKMDDTNHINGLTKKITKEDILLLLSLLEEKAKEAKEKGVGLEFVGD